MSRRVVELTRTAAKDPDRIHRPHRDQLVRDLRGLEVDPTGRPPRIKRLRGHGAPLCQLRSGDYRVVYRLEGDRITVLRIINRRDLERALRRLGMKRR